MSEIKPATSAYQLFQREKHAEIKASLEAKGQTADFGDVQRELSSRWKELGTEDPDRAKFERLAAEDRARFARESAAKDLEVAEAQRAKRAEREALTTDSRMRGRPKGEEPKPKKPMAPPRQLSEEEKARRQERKDLKIKEKAERDARTQVAEAQHTNIKDEIAKQASARLQFLLKQSDIFGHFGVGKHATKAEDKKKEEAVAAGEAPTSPGGKRRREAAGKGGTAAPAAAGEEEEEEEEAPETTFLTKQPDCIKFGTMRHYQLEGLNWMVRLNENGINGILADEMGLGKTLQSISVLAYMHEYKGISGPHIILVPKSTLSNWLNELKRWCPVLRPLRFHGTREERAVLIEERLRVGHNDRDWDVLITTYEVANLEKRSLQNIAWRYLIIDEAHRLKNEASMFSQTVRSFNMQHRLLLTGTPLQNNLHELWALLNFLLPDVFSSSEQFDQWFNLEIDDKEAKENIIHQLHKILRPFMLRRLKADVEKSLPPKTETILYVGLSSKQKEVYRNVLLRDIDMVNGKGGGGNAGRTVILNIVMQLRKCCNHPYLFAGVEDRKLDPLGEHLIINCGKMVLLDKLLKKMFDKGHRVLIFTQMTKMLDIFEDFCVMRRYEYCRIDGNTSYESREDCIDAYNKPGSTKFVFMLSTRAGGLGINLQTADTVILYDSDWNPQADLQAMDRAHRIGQKRPVSVYRLVTENTVEEKVVERAQQKLKLDAMIVQQGRLTDNAKKLGKEQLLDALRFGADQVFRSKDTSITDDDIDAIMAHGKEKTKALMESKLQVSDKGDLLDFSLDGGIATQVYEGVDYSNKANRADGGGGAVPLFIDTGKRERKKIASYKEDTFYRQQQAAAVKKRTLMPKHLRLPRMDECQFYDKKRLEQLHRQEEQLFAEAKEKGDIPNDLTNYEVLPEPLLAEKIRLLSEGFADWTKAQYMIFVRASAKHGRSAYDRIAAEVGKAEKDVERYAKAFWEKGSTAFAAADWERHVKSVEKGERKIEEINRLMGATKSFISKFANPWEQLSFHYTGTQGKVFNAHEDRYLLCLAHKYGYGNWDLVKAAIRRSDRFRFDYFLRSCSADALGKRCEALMKAAEKEDAEWHKRQGTLTDRGAGLGGSERAAEDKRRGIAETERHNTYKEFQDKLEKETEKLTEFQSDKTKLRDAFHADGNGGGGGGAAGADSASGSGKDRGAGGVGVNAGPDNVDRQLAYLVAQNQAGGSTSSRAQGQAKPVPDRLVGELARFACRSGSKGMEKVVTDFTAVHPEASKRQVEKKIQEIAYKEKRPGDVRDSWYIRPGFESLLDETLDHQHHSGEASPADADPKDRAAKATDAEGGEGSSKTKLGGSATLPSSAKKRRPHKDGERATVPARSPFYLFRHAEREAAADELKDNGVSAPTSEEIKDRVRMMWRELEDDKKEEYYKEAAKTGWVEEQDAGKGGGSGSTKRKASFSGDTASIVSGSSAPGSPSSAFTIPKRKKVEPSSQG
eukprot:g15364.t1